LPIPKNTPPSSIKHKGNIKDRAASLIAESAKEAVCRLQFFRQIYGTVPSVGEANLEQLKQVAASFFTESKLTLDWPDAHTNASEISVSHKLGKIALNVIFISSGILIHGGKLSVRLQKLPNGKRITITSTGHGLKVDELLPQLVTDKVDLAIITSRNVQMYYTFKFAKNAEARIAMNSKNDSVEFMIDQVR